MAKAHKTAAKRKRAGSLSGENGGGGQLDIFEELLQVFDDPQIEQSVALFRFPVDTTAEPDYLSEIEQPMDLSTIRAKLEEGQYDSPAEMSKDVDLMFANARKYNKTRYPWILKIADDLRKRFNANKARVLSKAVSAAAPAAKAKASPASGAAKAPAAPATAAAAKGAPKANGAAKAVPASQWVPKAQTILDNLRKRDKAKVFELPVDPVMIPIYPHVVPNPISFSEIGAKLQKQAYKTPEQFARDMRRVFANALRFNTVPGDAIRQLAREMQWAFESQWTHHFDDPLFPGAQIVLDCLDDIFQQEGSYSFAHPIASYYENKKLPPYYTKYVDKPMCLGDIASKTCEGEYRSFDQVREDIHRVFDNCRRYYTAMEPTSGFIALARRFEDHMMAYLDRRQQEIVPPPAPVAAAKPAKASAAARTAAPKSAAAPAPADEAAPAPVSAPAPAAARSATPKAAAQAKVKEKYVWVLDKLLKHKFKAERTQLWIQTAKFFEAAIDPATELGREYYAIIKNPIDLAMIRKNIHKGKYTSAAEFIADMKLLEDNCKEFNIGEAGLEIRIIVERLIAVFHSLLRHVLREIWASRDEGLKRAAGLHEQIVIDFMNQPDDPVGLEYVEGIVARAKPAPAPKPATQPKKAPAEPKAAPAAKADMPLTVKLTTLKRMSSAGVQEPPPSATSAPADENYEFDPHMLDEDMPMGEYVEPKSSMPPPSKARKKGKRKEGLEPRSPAPVRPPVVAPPTQRPAWHENAQRALAKLKRHDYVNPQSAKRPTDWFTPVLQLFPDEQFKQDYEYVIKRPMDLGTIEWNLQNDSILDVHQFYEDVCLVFENAITYNEPHTDDEAAIYLVKTSTIILQFWKALALEILPLIDDSKYDDEQKAQLGDLRTSRQAGARQERLAFVQSQKIVYLRQGRKPIDDLLKRLFTTKQQKDELRVFFNEPVNTKEVPNYLVHVSDPMDMGTINKKLDAEQYETYGEFLADVELVFSNAKAFNGVFRATDEWSEKVYQAAVGMEERYWHALHEDFTVAAADFCRRWSEIERFVHEQEIARQAEEEEEARLAEEQRNKAEYEERIRKGRERQDAARIARKREAADADYDEADHVIDEIPPPELGVTLRVPKDLQPARVPAQKETHTLLREEVFTRARSLWASVPSTPIPPAPLQRAVSAAPPKSARSAVPASAEEQQEVPMALEEQSQPAADEQRAAEAPERPTKLILEPTGSWSPVESAATSRPARAAKQELKVQLQREVRPKIGSSLPEFTEDRQVAVRGKGKGKGKGMSFELPTVAVWDKRAVWKPTEIPMEAETRDMAEEIELALEAGVRILSTQKAPAPAANSQGRAPEPPAGCILASACRLASLPEHPWFGHALKVFIPAPHVGEHTQHQDITRLSWSKAWDGAIALRLGEAQVTITTALTAAAAEKAAAADNKLPQLSAVAAQPSYHFQVPFQLYDAEVHATAAASAQFPFADLWKLDDSEAGCPLLRLVSDFGEYELNVVDQTVEAFENFHTDRAALAAAPSKPVAVSHIADGLFLLEQVEKDSVYLGSGWSGDCFVLTLLWRAVHSPVRAGILRRRLSATLTLAHATGESSKPEYTTTRAHSFESWPALSNHEVRVPAMPGGWRRSKKPRASATSDLPAGLQGVFAGEQEREEAEEDLEL